MIKDLIHFVQEVGAVVTINGSECKLGMREGNELTFFGDSSIIVSQKDLITSTYHGAGNWKVRKKVHGQVIAKYFFTVTINGIPQEIKSEENQ